MHAEGACIQGGHAFRGGQTLPPPPVDTATEAGGKHPTGMHSCLTWALSPCLYRMFLGHTFLHDWFTVHWHLHKTQAISFLCFTTWPQYIQRNRTWDQPGNNYTAGVPAEQVLLVSRGVTQRSWRLNVPTFLILITLLSVMCCKEVPCTKVNTPGLYLQRTTYRDGDKLTTPSRQQFKCKKKLS